MCGWPDDEGGDAAGRALVKGRGVPVPSLLSPELLRSPSKGDDDASCCRAGPPVLRGDIIEDDGEPEALNDDK